MNQQTKETKRKPMLTLTSYHTRRRVASLAQLILAGNCNPGTAVTFDDVIVRPIEHGKPHVGQPGVNSYRTHIGRVSSNDLRCYN